MFKTAFSNIETINTTRFSYCVVAAKNVTNSPEVETTITALNEENPDYSNRKRYHYTEQTEAVISDLH